MTPPVTNTDELAIASAAETAEREKLSKTWYVPRGFWGWFTAIDHRSIGRRFLVTTFILFGLAGTLAAIMRLQLSRPNNNLVGPDAYNQIFTTHGTAMMFLFAVPVFQALAIYFMPLMVGAREIAFPRLVTYGYWLFTFGGIFLFVQLVLNTGPDVGWFSYVPLAGPDYSPGKRADTWAQLVTFTETSAIVFAIAIITTIFKMRTPGMSLNRLPLFGWASLVTSFMVLFAMPAVVLASTMLILDRLVGTHFYNYAEGGDTILWQHLFWFFGHPEVYIIFIPATGLVSVVLPVFVRRQVFGYTALVLATIATGFMSFSVWVHHMFTTGLPQLGYNFFSAATMMVVIPTAVQFFCWIATLWSGKPHFRTPFMFVIGFFLIFLVGGLTGVHLASVPIDTQVHDTFFVVAHLHYVLIGGSVFPLFGALYFWLPKITGRLFSERLGHLNFWLMFVGFNLTFFPMHMLGLRGMTRRIYTYAPETGWGQLNTVASVGALILTLGIVAFVVNFLWSLRRGPVAGNDPWHAESLEWGTNSPPPNYNFLHIPVVEGRSPLWERSQQAPIVTGVRNDRREVLLTRMLDAEPDAKTYLPGPTIWPLAAAIATTVLFIGSIFTPWMVVWGSIPLAATLLAWFWPKNPQPEDVFQEKPWKEWRK
ncbi:MAG TPA: cytochrome c oxidase subunit I [Terriglobales bacterium]|nr:cytochrome c oxidase subunit I [Terriglobales bacterium]